MIARLPRLLAATALMGAPLLLSAAIAAPAPVAPAAQPVAAAPAGFTLTSLRDMLNAVPNDGSVFGKDAGQAAVADTLAQAGAPTDTVTLGVDALLVRGHGHTVLIDTGLGPKVSGALPRSLALAGVRPDAVDTVLVTHSHGDHVGGLVTAEGTLAFPHAAVRMSAAEWAWMQDKSPEVARVIAPRVRPFRPGETVSPGIVAIAIPGHTPGHVGYRIGTGAGALVDIGDTAHSAIVSLAHPEWLIGYDTDGALGRASREAWVAKLAHDGTRVFSPHFPFPGVGRVVKADGGYRWQPAA